jgi:hypothetical protein
LRRREVTAGERAESLAKRARINENERALVIALRWVRMMPDRKPPDRKPRKTPPQPPASETVNDARAANPAPAPSRQPKRIGRFEVRAVLGEGAFGRVYLAFDAELERQVAIKVPNVRGFTADMRERFVREARATAKIHHPNVCPVYEVGTEGDVPFIVMHYQPGTTLAAHLDKWNVLAPLNAVALAQRLALGVAAAHEQGVIHRDLKPQNVLFEPAKQLALITDFGLARIGVPATTVDGVVCGTPAYMSPEQASGKQDAVGPHSDVYSLGVILFRMLTGDVPFRGKVFEVLAQHTLAAPPPPSTLRPGIDPRLDALVLKALAKKPADRYPSAKAFAEALGEYTRGGSSSWTAPAAASATASGPLPKSVATAPVEPPRVVLVLPRRKVVWISLGAVIAVLLLAIVVLSVRSKKPAARPPEPDARGLTDAERIEFDRLRAEKKRIEDEKREQIKKKEAEQRAQAEKDNSRGDDFFFGREVSKDFAEARQWYEKAAAQGSAQAQYSLGTIFENGLGVPEDVPAALAWYEKAAAQGLQLAKDAVARLKKK